MRSVFLPARSTDGIATVVSTFYRFKMSGVSIQHYGNLEQRVRETKQRRKRVTRACKCSTP